MNSHADHKRESGPGWMAWTGVAAILLALAVILSLRLLPSVIPQGRDSGIFAYTGQVIHQGGLLYRDAWDNKPPGVYFLDALAFALFGANRWALWLIDLIIVFLAALVMFALLRQVFRSRHWLVWTGTVTLLLLARQPDLVWDTNFTEVFALLPQVICFAAGYQFMRRPGVGWAVVIGLSASAAFLTKQTTIGVAVAFIPAVLLSRHPVIRQPRRWTWLAAIIGGGLAGIGGVALVLLTHGLLREAIDAAFIMPGEFHRWVSGEPVPFWQTIRQSVMDSIVPDVIGPLVPLWGIGAVVAVRRAWSLGGETPANVTLGLWALLTLVADLVLANPTGRAYEHYYITLFPAVTLLIMLGLSALSGLRAWPDWGRGLVMAAALIYLALGVGLRSVEELVALDWRDIPGPAQEAALSQYVREHTRPGDRVLVWGASSEINFQADRRSPTAYHYGYALIVPGEASERRIRQVVHDLDAAPPVLIVDCALIDGDRIPPLDPVQRADWLEAGGRTDTADVQPVIDWVAGHCVYTGQVDDAAIYRCAP